MTSHDPERDARERKANLTRLPPRALAAAARVLEYDGDAHYAEGDWLAGDSRRHIDGALRHLLELVAGRDFDPSSREHVLANVSARVLMALELELVNLETGADLSPWRIYSPDTLPLESDPRPVRPFQDLAAAFRGEETEPNGAEDVGGVAFWCTDCGRSVAVPTSGTGTTEIVGAWECLRRFHGWRIARNGPAHHDRAPFCPDCVALADPEPDPNPPQRSALAVVTYAEVDLWRELARPEVELALGPEATELEILNELDARQRQRFAGYRIVDEETARAHAELVTREPRGVLATAEAGELPAAHSSVVVGPRVPAARPASPWHDEVEAVLGRDAPGLEVPVPTNSPGAVPAARTDEESTP